MLHKIKARRSMTQDELLELCKTEASRLENLQREKLHAKDVQLSCSHCIIVPGPTTEVVYKTLPPTNTIAVVVDISSSGGAIKIGEKANNDLGVAAVGRVGTEDASDLVIVPWNVDWWFYSIGSVSIQYVVKVG
ncbi:uncharacterized protein BO97DRAFT_279296 [Aspergillus homomorphus CBS 101889]|uniref:Uncharacterized protein n=1 Tax=Aspergillus homomorphus (strain CBS 101889) TaxID=1450537 RepID=A0A395HGL4_ASPHC|nr:hypothetical protein BO97DRAFT_279296 [Aspergillus homomorphus CBS 101889]RAL06786.1 hypothetical protein BO97DRAFT_279296 [Aspergillus homomorphus CBS 101889]